MLASACIASRLDQISVLSLVRKTEQSALTAESRCCASTWTPSNLRSGSKRADGL